VNKKKQKNFIRLPGGARPVYLGGRRGEKFFASFF
jgi:hypothetical protein